MSTKMECEYDTTDEEQETDEEETDKEDFDPNDDTTETNMLFTDIICGTCSIVCSFCVLLEVETEKQRNKFICHDCSNKCWKCSGIKGWTICKCDDLDEDEDE
jgi:hypothetical protein